MYHRMQIAVRREKIGMNGSTQQIISTLSGLLPLPLIGLLDDASHGSDDDTEG